MHYHGITGVESQGFKRIASSAIIIIINIDIIINDQRCSSTGGLIYNKDLTPAAPYLNVNGWLIMGSTFHGLHSIAAQVSTFS
jgi:Sybindin-like family